VAGWSATEDALTSGLPVPPITLIDDMRGRILLGQDPLGELFCSLRLPAERRKQGATYTPLPIIKLMIDWASSLGSPTRVVDPGIGSGRFASLAGQRFPECSILGIESDPLPAILARANLATLGLAHRSEVVLGDYRVVPIPPIDGKTLYLGNPPYVRHHLLEPKWKQWLVSESASRGLIASQLAGLHVHFFLATALKATPGDFGVFITAAEWLDVNYGKLLRDLFIRDLGGRQIVVIEPTAMPFPDAATTAAITTFEIGSQSEKVSLCRVETLSEVCETDGNHEVDRKRLEGESRWTHLTRPPKKGPIGYVELGEICRVHRGQVTGANKIWIAGTHSKDLPESVLYPTVTKARDLFQVGKVLSDTSPLRKVIDLPVNYLEKFDEASQKRINRFIEKARSLGADQSYVATNRREWWSVGLRKPAPILATYMARRPPAFVLNIGEARHINVAHGLYPRDHMNADCLTQLVDFLSKGVSISQGRTYAGGLTKFEPREMERLLVPSLELLVQSLGEL